MALYIVLTKDEIQPVIQWHVGSELPKVDINQIDYIQADGDELFHIIQLFKFRSTDTFTIPIPFDKRVVKWYGDIAKTIIANL